MNSTLTELAPTSVPFQSHPSTSFAFSNFHLPQHIHSSTAGPRVRTTSLLSSVSSGGMPLFGKLSFGRRPHTDPSGEVEERAGARVGKGKGKATDQDAPAVGISKPPKSLSTLLIRRVSTAPSSAAGGTASKRPTPPSRRRASGERSMADYERRAGTFSKSSPDLGGIESQFQPWPSGEETATSSKPSPPATPTPRRTRATSAFTPSTIRNTPNRPDSPLDSDGDEAEEDDELFSTPLRTPSSPVPRSLLATSLPPSLPSPFHRRHPYPSRDQSTSPPPSPAQRAAARAEALERLTNPRASASSSPSRASTIVPFPKRPPPPAPTRAPPSPPPPRLQQESSTSSFELDDTAAARSSGEAWPRSRPTSIGSPAPVAGTQSGWAEMERKVLQPTTPSRARSRGSTSKLRVSGGKAPEEYETEEGFRRGVRSARRFLEKELGGKVLDGDEMDRYEAPERVEEAELWAGLRDGVVFCRCVSPSLDHFC